MMKILAIQNRMGIGDTVIFLPFIKAISKKYKTPVSILVQKSSKSDQYLDQTSYINKIILLERNNKIKKLKHNGFVGSIRLSQELKKLKFDKIFIFNSSLRFYLIAKLSGIKDISQFPLFKKKGQDMIKASQELISKELNISVEEDPSIEISKESIKQTAKEYNFSIDNLNVLLGIGGSGPTKRIPAKTYLEVMRKLTREKKCKFYLATGSNIEEQKILNEIKNSELGTHCVPLDKLSIKECLPIIKNCSVSICNDTSFSHLSSALGIKTITLMADTPLMYGNYSSKMYPILPDNENFVTHGTLGKKKINAEKIFNKLISILN